MKFQNFKNQHGFTLMEILVVLGIITIIASLTFYFFGKANKQTVLEKDVASVVSFVRNARLLSIASKNASPFGIHLEEDKVVLFEGNPYSAGGPNEKTFYFSREVYLSSYSLNKGGSDIIFARLTGDTSNYGTVTVSLRDNSASTTFTILKTGVIQ